MMLIDFSYRLDKKKTQRVSLGFIGSCNKGLSDVFHYKAIRIKQLA